jgi:hypothetical protein
MSRPDVDYLFRFRDLVAETLDAHRAILRAMGRCWWGWWKRPHEPEHGPVWDDLAARAKDGGVWIGLFDSGASSNEHAVWRARVVDVRPPALGGMPALDATEAELVPEYYRDSPFSRAWLVLDEIEDQPIADFFESYSYRVEPELRGLEAEQLQHLRDKRIVGAGELKLMDTTIWSVRRKREGDPEDRFLAPSLRVAKAVSREPIPVDGCAILHLTDLHFASGTHADQHNWEDEGSGSLAARVLACLKERRVEDKIGVVIVTGDCIFSPQNGDAEFAKAAAALNRILGVLGLDAQNLVIVPGNHDIAWTKPGDERYEDGRVAITRPPAEATAAYRRFYRTLMRHEPHPDLAMARRFVMSSGVLVDVCALNSNNLETGRSYLAGLGRVGGGVFQDVRGALGWDDERVATALRILALHHHLTNAEDVEDPAEYERGFGMAIDAKSILRQAASSGVHLVLHGHRHRELFWREHVYELPERTQERWELGEVSILGGGSAGSSDLPGGGENFFRLIEVGRDGLLVDVFRSGDGRFRRMKRWSAPLGYADGRLKLGPWEPS